MCCKFSRLKKHFRAPLVPKLPVLTRCELVWVRGPEGGGGLVSGLIGKGPLWWRWHLPMFSFEKSCGGQHLRPTNALGKAKGNAAGGPLVQGQRWGVHGPVPRAPQELWARPKAEGQAD